MSSLIKLAEIVDVVIGVDTHVDSHAAAAVDAATGGVLAQITVPATGEGYAELVEFADQVAEQHGALRAWAIEGTGSHGRGLTMHLHRLAERAEAGPEIIVELDRPVRAARRGGAKSDPLDAVRAAREALTRGGVTSPRGGGRDTTTAQVRQALAARLAVRRSAVQAAADAQRQLFSAVLTAPEPVRARLRGLGTNTLLAAAAKLSTTAAWARTDIETATAVATIKTLAKRAQYLHAEAIEHERHLKQLVSSWRPELLDELGVGPVVAAIVLCAWSHPGRIHSEAAFAKLAGTSPVEATSGKIHTRHRLNRYGDRRLNSALHTIAITRQRHHDPDTHAYIARRTTEGKNPREIRRCLKRYIARDLYRLLEHTTPTPLDQT